MLFSAYNIRAKNKYNMYTIFCVSRFYVFLFITILFILRFPEEDVTSDMGNKMVRRRFKVFACTWFLLVWSNGYNFFTGNKFASFFQCNLRKFFLNSFNSHCNVDFCLHMIFTFRFHVLTKYTNCFWQILFIHENMKCLGKNLSYVFTGTWIESWESKRVFLLQWTIQYWSSRNIDLIG